MMWSSVIIIANSIYPYDFELSCRFFGAYADGIWFTIKGTYVNVLYGHIVYQYGQNILYLYIGCICSKYTLPVDSVHIL